MMNEIYDRLHKMRYLRFHPEAKQQMGYFPTPKAQRFISVKSSVATFGSSSKELANYDKLQILNQLAAKF